MTSAEQAVSDKAGLLAPLGRLTGAATAYTEALALHRQVGDRHYEGQTLCSNALLEIAQPETAREHRRQRAKLLRACTQIHDFKRAAAEMRKTCAAAGILPFDEHL